MGKSKGNLNPGMITPPPYRVGQNVSFYSYGAEVTKEIIRINDDETILFFGRGRFFILYDDPIEEK